MNYNYLSEIHSYACLKAKFNMVGLLFD